MTALDFAGDENGGIIRVTIETYLAAFGQASNRTYLDQERYDPDDLSARASIAIANGLTQNPGAIIGGGGGGYSGGYGGGINGPRVNDL